MKRIAWLLLFFVIPAQGTTWTDKEVRESILKEEKKYNQFDGTWQGRIKAFELEGGHRDRPYDQKLRIVISKDSVQLFTGKNSKWVKQPYHYKIIRYRTNVLVYAHISKVTSVVESVSFLLTLRSKNQMQVLWQRTVNNFTTDPARKGARQYYQMLAIFKRVKK